MSKEWSNGLFECFGVTDCSALQSFLDVTKQRETNKTYKTCIGALITIEEKYSDIVIEFNKCYINAHATDHNLKEQFGRHYEQCLFIHWMREHNIVPDFLDRMGICQLLHNALIDNYINKSKMLHTSSINTNNTPMSSLFDCKLTPVRIQLLITGYYKQAKTFQQFIGVDVINLIAHLFDELFYMKIQPLYIQIEPLYIDTHLNPIERADALEGRFKLMHKDNILTMPQHVHNYIINNDFIFQIFPNSDNFEWKLKLITKWDIVQNVIFRIRIFPVTNCQNNFTYDEICCVKSTKTHKFAFNSWYYGINNNATVGVEIDIVNIRWSENKKYWSKWPYPWCKNQIDHTLYYFDDFYRYQFDPLCFGLNCKYYSLTNHDKVEKLSLPVVWLKQNRETILLQNEGQENDDETPISYHDYICWNELLIMNKKKSNKRSNNRFKNIQMKSIKLHKTFRNKKRKYQYHRW